MKNILLDVSLLTETLSKVKLQPEYFCHRWYLHMHFTIFCFPSGRLKLNSVGILFIFILYSSNTWQSSFDLWLFLCSNHIEPPVRGY